MQLKIQQNVIVIRDTVLTVEINKSFFTSRKNNFIRILPQQ